MKTTLYMLTESSKKQMMSYVLQTNSGKLIVIDGGNRADAGHLLEKLIYLGGNKPKVSLWLLTHPHPDHIGALLKIMHEADMVKVDKVYSRFWSYEFYMNGHGPIEWELDSSALKEFDEFTKKHSSICGSLEKGQQFVLDDVSIKILHVPETPIYEGDKFNNSSSIFRIEVGGQRVLFLGDLAEEGGRQVLESVKSEELKADIVQMAHHGQNGVGKEFYEAVSPQICLWNTPQWLWDNDDGQGYNSGPWKTLEVRNWMKDIGVAKNYISKDGDHAFPLPFQMD